jgi:SAM-dependent methyltransferase
MFAPDVVSLRQFYSSPLGESCRALIGDSILDLWPDARGDLLLAVGYALPYLEEYLAAGAQVISCMPSGQGAVYWPANGTNKVFMAHESELPLADNTVNRVLLVHTLEHTEQLTGLMQEAWRVLTPGGRMLAVVPNRHGFWSRSPRSPFGYGRPFSLAQLKDLIARAHFTATRSTSALMVPTTRLQFVWRAAAKIEKFGKMCCGFFGGVWIIEAEKQLYAAIKQPVHAKRGYGVAVPAAATKPVMSFAAFFKRRK